MAPLTLMSPVCKSPCHFFLFHIILPMVGRKKEKSGELAGNDSTSRTGEATLRKQIINKADQTLPGSWKTLKSLFLHWPTTEQWPAPRLCACVCVCAGVFLPLCSEPLRLTPLASVSLSLFLSLPLFPAHGSRIQMPMYYGWGVE